MKSTTERSTTNVAAARYKSGVLLSNATGLFIALLNDLRLALDCIAPNRLRAACSRLVADLVLVFPVPGKSRPKLLYIRNSHADAIAAMVAGRRWVPVSCRRHLLQVDWDRPAPSIARPQKRPPAIRSNKADPHHRQD
ncbi:MAG: hypothetical protein ACJ8R9_33900 [Steroidobacteraceae bacterium]